MLQPKKNSTHNYPSEKLTYNMYSRLCNPKIDYDKDKYNYLPKGFKIPKPKLKPKIDPRIELTMWPEKRTLQRPNQYK